MFCFVQRSGIGAALCYGRLALLCLLLLGAGQRLEAQSTSRLEGGDPIFWCDGITQVDDLELYQAVGFNTVVVHLYWMPGPDGAVSANQLQPQRNFAAAAARLGLKVIYSLPATPTGLEGRLRIAADSEVYTTLWVAWVEGAIQSLKTTPNLVGWMLPRDPRGQAIFDDIGLQNWIGRNYANVGVINKQWGSGFESLDDISIADVIGISARWQGLGPATSQMTSEELQARSELGQPGEKPGFAFHPSALALAQYRYEAYSNLVRFWASTLKTAQPNRLVLSGRLPDYAQLMSMPPEVDISVPDMAPQGLEKDLVTHNPQAIDAARRGGLMGALPMFSPQAGPDIPAASLQDLAPRWIQSAWARGAVGCGFSSWEELMLATGLQKAIAETLGRLTTGSNARLWGSDPVNTAAIVLTPLADGTMIQHGQPPLQFPRGLFGFGEDLVVGEPSDLVSAMRWGTAYGGLDYLAPEDLLKLRLDKYTTIFLPQAFSITNEVAARLAQYAANGGAVVADLGIGALQNGGQANGFSSLLATLFGVPNTMEIKPVPFNLAGLQTHRLFPNWTRPVEGRSGAILSAGDGPNGAAFYGPVGYSFAPSRALPVARAPEIAQDFLLSKRVWKAQLTVNEVRLGYALFAPFRLWTSWRPGHPGFDTFHGDLLGRGSLIAMAGAASLVPSPARTPDGSTQFSESVNHVLGVVMTNNSAPNTPPHLAALQTPGTGDWLWNEAICYLPNVTDPSLGAARPAPLPNASDYQSRTRPLVLYARMAPAQSQLFAMRPIAVQNVSGGPVAARIAEEAPKKLLLNVWPNSPMVLATDGEWQPTLGESNNVRVQVFASSDGYQMERDSLHRVVITDYAKGADKKGRFSSETRQVQADAEGKLTFEFAGIACAVEITPTTQVTASAKKK